MSPFFSLIITYAIWGAAAPIFKYSLTNVPPFTLAFIRFFFAGLLLIPFSVKSWKVLTLREFVIICVGAFFGITINISFYFLGLLRADSIAAPVIASSGPIFLFFLSVFYLREPFQARIFYGMIVSLIGVIILVFFPFLGKIQTQMNPQLLGNLYFLIATLGATLHPVIYKNLSKKISTFQITVIGFLFSSFTFFPFMLHELNDWWFDELEVSGVFGILYGVIFSSATAYVLMVYALSKMKVEDTSVFHYISPLVALFVAYPLLGERPNISYFFGFLFIVFGLLYAEKKYWYNKVR